MQNLGTSLKSDCLITTLTIIFMAHSAIPIIAFHGVEYIYIYIYIYIHVYIYIIMFVSLTRVCVVYVVKEVASFWGARSINGRALELQTSRKNVNCN